MILLFSKVFFLPADYSLNLKTLQQQQSQDLVLRTVYSWLTCNEKPEFLTPFITGTPFLHAYYKRFSQLFIESSTNLISLCTTNTILLQQTKSLLRRSRAILSEFVFRYECLNNL